MSTEPWDPTEFDLPPGTSLATYRRLQGLRTTAAVALAGGLALLAFGLSDLPWPAGGDTPEMSVAQAAAVQGELPDWVLIEGRIMADRPVLMPDNKEAVVRGRVLLKAFTQTDIVDNIVGTDELEAVILSWSDAAGAAYLEAGGARVPFATPPGKLPMAVDELARRFVGRVDGGVEAAPTVRYFGTTYTVDDPRWLGRALTATVDRRLLRHGAQATVTARVRDGQLFDVIDIEEHTDAEARSWRAVNHVAGALAGLALLIFGAVVVLRWLRLLGDLRRGSRPPRTEPGAPPQGGE